MNALKATKRLTLLMMALILILTTNTVWAKDDDQGYLGVMLQDVSSSMAKALQLDDDVGVMISQVVEDGPADRAGLEDGDVILSFDGKDIEDWGDLTKAVRKSSPGDTVELEILHDGKRSTKEVELGENENNTFSYSFSTDEDAPHVQFFGEGGGENVIFMTSDDSDGSWAEVDGSHKVTIQAGDEHEGLWYSGDDSGFHSLVELTSNSERGFMGVELGELNEQLGEYFGVEDGEGALINKVRDDSAAEDAGLRAGDVIVSINDESVADAGEVHEIMADTEPEQVVEVQVVRHGKDKVVEVTLGEASDGDFVFDFKMPQVRELSKIKRHFSTRVPSNIKHKLKNIAPHSMPKVLELRRLDEDREDLEEVREELDELRKELKELQEELEK